MKRLFSVLLALCLLLPAGALAVGITAEEFIVGQFVPYILKRADSYCYDMYAPSEDPERPNVCNYWFGTDADGADVLCVQNSAASYAEYLSKGVCYAVDGQKQLRTATLYSPAAFIAQLSQQWMYLGKLFPDAENALPFELVSEDALVSVSAMRVSGSEVRLVITLQPSTFVMMQYDLYAYDGEAYQCISSIRTQLNPALEMPESLRAFVASDTRAVTLHSAGDVTVDLRAPVDTYLRAREVDGYRTLYTDAALTQPFDGIISSDTAPDAVVALYVGDLYPQTAEEGAAE